MDFEKMSIEELEAENTKLSNQRDQIREAQKALWVVLDRKLAEREAEKKANPTPV